MNNMQKNKRMKSALFKFQLEGDGLHRSIASAIPSASIMLIEGRDGSGKSVLSQRLSYGFLINGYTVTYISTELTTKEFLDQMKALNYPVIDFMLDEKLLFIPVFPTIGRIKSRKDFLTRFMRAQDLFTRDIIVVDSFSSLIYEELKPENVLSVLSFLKKVVSRNKLVILTLDPDVMEKECLHHFRSTTDIYFHLEQTVDEGLQVNRILIKRFLKAEGQIGNIVGFRVIPGAGVVVDITAVS